MTKFSTQIMPDEEIAKIKTISGNYSEDWAGTKQPWLILSNLTLLA